MQAAAVAGFPPDIPTAVGILLLDGTVGTRIVAKYFDSAAFADLKAEVRMSAKSPRNALARAPPRPAAT